MRCRAAGRTFRHRWRPSEQDFDSAQLLDQLLLSALWLAWPGRAMRSFLMVGCVGATVGVSARILAVKCKAGSTKAGPGFSGSG